MVIKTKYFSLKIVCYLLVIFIYGIVSNNSNLSGAGIFSFQSIMKYGSLLVFIVVSSWEFYKKNPHNNTIKLNKEYANFLLFFVIIVMLSLFEFIKNPIISLRVFQSFFFTFTPMLIGYLVINTWDREEIEFALKVSLVISFVLYIFSLNMSISNIFNSFLGVTYSNTDSSLLESNTFPLLALGFCAYFFYYPKNNLLKIMSFIFVFMTFKRVVMLTAVVLFVVSLFKFKKNKVYTVFFFICISLLIFLSFAYIWAIQPQHILQSSSYLGMDLRSFSTNRTDRLLWLQMSNFESYGFGSSTDFMYRNFNNLALEMDVVALFVEIGWISVVAFFTFYLKFVKNNLYSFLLFMSLLINSIFSSGMSSTFGWIVIFVSVSAILLYPDLKKGEKYDFISDSTCI